MILYRIGRLRRLSGDITAGFVAYSLVFEAGAARIMSYRGQDQVYITDSRLMPAVAGVKPGQAHPRR